MDIKNVRWEVCVCGGGQWGCYLKAATLFDEKPPRERKTMCWFMTKKMKRFHQRFPFCRISESFIFVSVSFIMALDQRDVQYNCETKKRKRWFVIKNPCLGYYTQEGHSLWLHMSDKTRGGPLSIHVFFFQMPILAHKWLHAKKPFKPRITLKLPWIFTNLWCAIIFTLVFVAMSLLQRH